MCGLAANTDSLRAKNTTTATTKKQISLFSSTVVSADVTVDANIT